MKKIKFLLPALVLLAQYGVAQKINFSYARPSVQKIDSIESANAGKLLSYKGITFQVSKNYFPNSDNYNLAQPVFYTRETQPLKTSIEYYYSIPDSIVRLVEYTWNATSDKIGFLTEIFEYNSAQFSKVPEVKSKTEVEDHGDWTQKTAIWETEKVHIKQFMVTGSNTFRVRVLLSWK